MVSGAGSHTLSLSCSGKPNMSKITLSVSSLKYTNLKDRDYPTLFFFLKKRMRRKTQLHVVYKKLISDMKTYLLKLKG